MSNSDAFHADLHDKDTETQTFGCRHANPDNCKKHSLPQVCAFVRPDNICLEPSSSWRKQYWKLRLMHDAGELPSDVGSAEEAVVESGS